MLNSSTFSFSNSRVRWLYASVALGLSWIVYLQFGPLVSDALSTVLGREIVRLSHQKVMTPSLFIQKRLFEVVYLATVVVLLLGLGHCAYIVLRQFISKTWLWFPLALVLILEVNLFVACASETALYWIVLYMGGPNIKQSGFHIQRILHREEPAPSKGLLIGSSQVSSEISENVLNKAHLPHIHWASLSYAGAQAFDFLLVQHSYRKHSPDIVLCYLSEMNLYRPVSGHRYLPLLGTRGLIDFYTLGGDRFNVDDDVLFGAIGTISPVVRSRRAIEYCLFGTDVGRPQFATARRAAADKDQQLIRRASALAQTYRIGPASDFQKLALERFLIRSRTQGTKVVLITGQVNPILATRLNPRIRTDFLQYLHWIDQNHSNVVVLHEELPQHGKSDYEDLMHITDREREQYSEVVADVLSDILHLERHGRH